MNKKKLLAAFIATTVATPAVYAMSDKEVEARFDKYEAQIKALQAEVKDLKANGGVVYIQDLQKQEKRNAAQIDSIKSKMDSDAERLKMNGFMTAAVSMGDDPIDAGYEIDSNPNFRGDAKAGLQFNYSLGQNDSAVMQLVARSRGGQPWQTTAEWAYISHSLSESLQARMGRLRIPLYLESETLDVGYSYPWVRPPVELYQTALTSYEGADMLYKFSTGEVNHTLQPFVGSSTKHHDDPGQYGYVPLPAFVPGSASPNENLQLDFKDLYGITLNSTWGNFTTKATAMHLGLDAQVTALDNSFLVANALLAGMLQPPAFPNVGAGGVIAENVDQLQYYAVGGMYDDGTWLAMLEESTIRTKHGALFGDNISGQATLGYRIDKWTPYGTYAWTQSQNVSDFAQPNRKMKSASLGLRHELTNNLSAKMEWNHYYDFTNNGSYGSGSNSLAGSLGDNANVYTFALDAVF
ncbi:MAG TPA: hypothetical protein PLF22_01810 [Pseudomonadales bacterium]|nr:hypothetical protein [Pseudomonadales bacterium]